MDNDVRNTEYCIGFSTAITRASDATYDLRSGEPNFVDKLVGLTFANMAYDAILEGKTGLTSALVEGRYELVPCMDGARSARKKNLTFRETIRVQPCIRPLNAAVVAAGPDVIH
jgi:6-phosphofructokinase